MTGIISYSGEQDFRFPTISLKKKKKNPSGLCIFAFIQQQKQEKGTKTLSGKSRERETQGERGGEKAHETDKKASTLRDEILGEQDDRPF